MIARAGIRLASAATVALLLAAVWLAIPGCFLRRHRTATREEPALVADITLSVTNHNFLDVVVYVLHDGQRTRVGTVTGSSTQVFTLPRRLLGQGGEIQLYGDPIGSEDYALTELLLVHPGQYIEWTLESNLRRSSVGVY